MNTDSRIVINDLNVNPARLPNEDYWDYRWRQQKVKQRLKKFHGNRKSDDLVPQMNIGYSQKKEREGNNARRGDTTLQVISRSVMKKCRPYSHKDEQGKIIYRESHFSKTVHKHIFHHKPAGM